MKGLEECSTLVIKDTEEIQDWATITVLQDSKQGTPGAATQPCCSRCQTAPGLPLGTGTWLC